MRKFSIDDLLSYRESVFKEDSYTRVAEESGLDLFIERVPRNVGLSFYKALGVPTLYHAFVASWMNPAFFGASVSEVTRELARIFFAQRQWASAHNHYLGLNKRGYLLS